VKNKTGRDFEPPDLGAIGSISWENSQTGFLVGVELDDEVTFCQALKAIIKQNPSEFLPPKC